MAFGLPDEQREQRLSYGGYLKVGELIALQELLSDPPQHDETLFIIIHQVYELWFKQLLHEIDTLVERLDADEVLGAHRLLRRCVEIQRVLVSQVAVLETMTPVDFLAFRDHLTPASGFQSAQFREIEFVSGLKNPRFLTHYEEGSPERERLDARLAQPTVIEAFYAMLRRRGFDLPEAPENGDEARATQAHERRIRELLRIYRETERHYDLFLLTESLIDYDEQFTLWRLRHVAMVERMIGSKPGTGGSPGASYLKSTVERKFFPELWEMRSYLGKQPASY
ncbi:tryptophan 2,3-dioxygenase family protein [soil metagenome]